MSTAPENYGPYSQADQIEAARNRVTPPGIMLLVAGILSLLLALFMIFRTVQIGLMTLDEFMFQMEQSERMMGPMFGPGGQLQNYTPAEFKRLTTWVMGIWGGLSLLAALLTLAAGLEIRKLRSYPLVMVGSIVAAIPCLSCSGCCGVGEVAGIWAVVVLLNQEVRAAFR